MRTIERSSRFKRDFKRERKGKHRKKLEEDFRELIELLVSDEPLPAQYCDHSLTGNWNDYRDCHLYPDLVLIYRKTQNGELRILRLARIGSHSELFK